MKQVLEQLSEVSATKTLSAADMQGTSGLLEKDLVTKANIKIPKPEGDEELCKDNGQEQCNKDTGEVFKLHNWSRGVFFIITPGGIIQSWSPLYRAENPLQVALILINFLCLKLDGVPESKYKDFFVCY